MKLFNITILLTFLLSGCSFVSGPQEKIGFSNTSSLANLSGLYKNEGDPGASLSQILFGYSSIQSSGEKKLIDHKSITHIAVKVIDNRVNVRAIQNDCYVYERVFIEGEDFEITHGEIVLKRKVSLLSRGPDDVLVGPVYEKIVIGLEKDGDGVYRSQVYGGGLVFLLFPVVFKELDEVRFERVESNLQFIKCAI